MKSRPWTPGLVAAMLVGGLMTSSDSAEAQCLSASDCAALKVQLQAFREDVKPLRDGVRDIRRRARDLPRGSEERRALRRQVREIRRELRETRREHEIRKALEAYRDGCKRC